MEESGTHLKQDKQKLSICWQITVTIQSETCSWIVGDYYKLSDTTKETAIELLTRVLPLVGCVK